MVWLTALARTRACTGSGFSGGGLPSEPGVRLHRGWSLQQCRQADVDKWLLTSPGVGHVRDFLSCAAAPRALPGARRPPPAHESGTSPSQDLLTKARNRSTISNGPVNHARRRHPMPHAIVPPTLMLVMAFLSISLGRRLRGCSLL